MSAAAKAAASTGVAVGSDTNTKVGKELISLRDKQMGPNVSVFYKQDGGLVITSGSGVFMRDIDGNLHLDCCNNVACVGHAHPNVVRAGQQELANIQTNGRFLNPIQQRYVTKLLETFPPELNTVYLVNSGSEANDLALRIARAHTKAARPQDVIVLDSAYHGHTQAIVDISPYKWYQAIDGKNYQPSTTHVAELPDGFRGKYRLGQTEYCGELYAREIQEIVNGPDGGVGTFIAESIVGCGGQVVPPPGYLRRCYEAVRAKGGVCIADEVQTGFARAGTHFWMFQEHGVVPDIVTCGKPMGNGYPVAAVICRREVAQSFAASGWYYQQFQAYTDHHELSWGTVNHDTQIYKLALSSAVKDLLLEYVDDVTNLEESLNTSDVLPLSHFIHHLQKYLIVFPQLFSMLHHIEEAGLRGCQIVDYFTKYPCGVQVMSDMIDRIVARLRVPLLKQIFAWMVFGTLQDEAREFFIQMRYDHKANDHVDMPLSKEQRLMMRLAEAQEASFKSTAAAASDKEASLLKDMPYTREEIESFDAVFKQVFQNPERAVELLEKAIELVCHSVSSRLWVLLKDHLGFYEYLHIIRNTYLMGKGELMQCIIDDLHVLSQQTTPALEDIDDTLNWRVLRNAGKLVGLADEDDIHRILQLNVQSHTLTVEKFHTDDHRFLTMAGIAQYQYPTSTSVPEEEKRRYIFNPTGLLLCVPKALSLAEHYATLWREKHVVQLHQHGQQYRHPLAAEEDVAETGNPWRFSRHYRGSHRSIDGGVESRYGYTVHLIGPRPSTMIDGSDHDTLDDAVPGPHEPPGHSPVTLEYSNAAVWFTDPKYVTKGFDVSVAFRPAWQVARSISAEHRVFHSRRAQETRLWPHLPEAYPFPRCHDVILGSTSVCVHADGRGLSAVGQGELNRHIQHSLLIGVSFHACVFDTSSALDRPSGTHRTVHARKNHDPSSSSSTDHVTKSGVKYYARIFVARGGNDGLLRLPLNKRLQVNIGDGYYRAPDPLVETNNADDYILAEKIVDLDKNLGYFPENTIRSLTTLSSRMHLDVSYQRVMQYQSTAASSASVASSFATAASTAAGGAGAGDIFQGLRERGVYQNSAASAVPTVAGRSTVGGGGSTVHMVGEVAHRMRVRLRPDEDYDSDTDDRLPSASPKNARMMMGQAGGLFSTLPGSQSWDVDIPLDLSVFVKNASGQVCVGAVSSGKGSLYSYPVCSPFTSARYPDTFLQLEREVSKIRAWMHLKLQIHFPAVFTVIFDVDSKRNYERVFSLVMKVRLVARLLEKLWMARSKWMTDRLYCNLRHAMHFFISNLLYYLQVDVVDSEYAAFQQELRHLTEFQAVLMAHRHFLANILRLAMLDNQAIQECFDRLLHLCLRFVAACRIQARSEAMYMESGSSATSTAHRHGGHESVLDETAAHLPAPRDTLQTPMLNRSKLSLSPTPNTGASQGTPHNTSSFVTPTYIPIEEFETIRKEFFQQLTYLLQFMKKVESRGFLFRLDFNGYISQHAMDLGHHA
eukprot:gene4998-3570_t